MTSLTKQLAVLLLRHTLTALFDDGTHTDLHWLETLGSRQTNDFSILGDTGREFIKEQDLNALLKKSLAEFIGVTVFLTAITASGGGLKTLALAIALGTMILVTGPISGGHLNPAVSLYFFAKKEITAGTLLGYVVAQLAGGAAGVYLGAFLSQSGSVPGFQSAGSIVPGYALVGEALATAGLIWIIQTLINNKQTALIPYAVAAWVFSAANFTVTGAQANPAVTFGLMLKGAAGVSSNLGSLIIIAELVGVAVALGLGILFAAKARKKK